ncbi:uncharacterized protein At4g22758-like [Arachis stenosperma]|uniref:uncharacterized protein At4g22758-like n=1 Tax=Arachis stenosperma TaxID=217475 RepID=UPI0025AB9F2C|nr:uncharacterized protein At4g22758-like [Arachis stenosperma]
MKKESAFEKMVMQKKKSKGSHEDQKKQQCNRLLVSINVVGSVGPIRFVVNEKDTVSVIIETALKSYAREGRLPLLGFDPTDFLLYNAWFDALNPLEAIGSYGVRNFVLCKKQVCSSKAERNTELISQKSNGSSGWKAWFNKSFGLKILSH